MRISHVPFGTAGFSVSRLCFGTLQLRLVDVPPGKAADLFVGAFDLGVNFFDVSHMYGTQPHLGVALKRLRRDEVVVSSRSGVTTREEMKRAFEEALEQLGTDYIDIYGLHQVDDEENWRVKQPAWEYVLERKEAGQIRAAIVTTHWCAFGERLAADPDVDGVMGMYNMAGFGLLRNETLEDAERQARAITAAGKAFIAMKPVAAGGFTDRVDEALGFYVDRPYITCVAIGMQSLAEVQMNIHLIEGQPVPDDVRQRVTGQSRRLLIREWCEGCGLCVEICPQGAMEMCETDAGSRPRVDDTLCVLCGYCSLQCPSTAAKTVSTAPVME